MGYFTTKVAFSEGGYETKNTMFAEGMEELLVKSVLEILEGLK